MSYQDERDDEYLSAPRKNILCPLCCQDASCDCECEECGDLYCEDHFVGDVRRFFGGILPAIEQLCINCALRVKVPVTAGQAHELVQRVSWHMVDKDYPWDTRVHGDAPDITDVLWELRWGYAGVLYGPIEVTA